MCSLLANPTCFSGTDSKYSRLFSFACMKIDNTDKNAISESAFYVIQMILEL